MNTLQLQPASHSPSAGEIERLNKVARDSWYTQPTAVATIVYSMNVFSRFWGDRRTCLELGPAEGLGTRILHDRFEHLTLVEGSPVFCGQLRQRFPDADVIESLFEDYEPDRTFDVVVLGHVLEHVVSPALVLGRARKWLSPGGIICAAVPNARSLHRQAAVMMGLLTDVHQLNATDLHHGHRRVYDPVSFKADFLAAGLTIDTFGGYWLKPLSNAQIEAAWTPQMLDAFMRLGEDYPEIAGEIYIIASA